MSQQEVATRYSVTTYEGTLRNLSWEDALLYYRSSRRSQLDRLTRWPDATVACYLMAGDRTIAALLIVGKVTLIDTAIGYGWEHLNREDD